MFRRILVALDGSEDSKHALERAIELARGLQVERLGLVHVIAPQEYWMAGVGYEWVAEMLTKVYEDLHANAQALLADAKKRAGEVLGDDVEITIHSLTGSVASSIIQLAREAPYDLLVMGSRGMGRAAGLLLGSVSQTVVANLPCSVLIVRRDEQAGKSEEAS